MINHLIASYGVFLIATAIAIECFAIPLVPGEAVMIAAAIYAGTTHEIGIGSVIAAGAIGAVIGNIGGYFLGREFGYRLLVRYGSKIGMSDNRIKIARYLFREHGAKVVVVGRFVTVLRSVASILAGANHMAWTPFFVATLIGGVVWTSLYGFAAYYLGDEIHRLAGPAAGAIAVAVIVAVVLLARALRRREAHLSVEAEKAYPGPLT